MVCVAAVKPSGPPDPDTTARALARGAVMQWIPSEGSSRKTFTRHSESHSATQRHSLSLGVIASRFVTVRHAGVFA